MASLSILISSCGQQRFGPDWADSHADLSLRWAQGSFYQFCLAMVQYVVYTLARPRVCASSSDSTLVDCAITVKPVLSGHSKIDKMKVLMKVESIAECSVGAFCNTFDLHKATICYFERPILVFFRVAA